jgi:hypothetical protein
MKNRFRFIRYIGLAAFLAISTASCAKKSYINVAYQLPAPSASLMGKKIRLEVKDLRSNTEIFGAPAKEEFKYFTGLFSLSVVDVDKQSTVIGAYELVALFRQTLKTRLENMGVQVADSGHQDLPLMEVAVKSFKIDLVGRTWKADVSYEASLTRDNRLIAREAVSGSAERVKLMGSGAAERIIGELFSELINRLDIQRLFAQAML